MTRPRYIRPDPGSRVPRTAMVMAAGVGKRMRPLTATRPKPLVEVRGRALIDHVFDRLRAAGVGFTVISARPMSGIRPLLEPLGLDGDVAAFNGGIVFRRDGTIVSHVTIPADIARAAVFLASPEADAVTGVTLDVYGIGFLAS